MTKRNRKAYDLDEGVHEALRLRALHLSFQRRREVSLSEVLNEILRHELADELREVSEAANPGEEKRRRKPT